jgi:putative hydrolase of the HAD superfamily
VITNSFEGHADLILKKLGLHDFFEVVADGGKSKALKPMPQAFEYVLEQLAVKPSSALYVGDEYYADIFGATSLGIDAVWINSRNHSFDELVAKYGEKSQPKVVLSSIIGLVDYFCNG